MSLNRGLSFLSSLVVGLYVSLTGRECTPLPVQNSHCVRILITVFSSFVLRTRLHHRNTQTVDWKLCRSQTSRACRHRLKPWISCAASAPTLASAPLWSDMSACLSANGWDTQRDLYIACIREYISASQIEKGEKSSRCG